MENIQPTLDPPACKAVRAVGVIQPKFSPKKGGVFADHLDVKGTAFWLKEYKFLVSCAHVVEGLLAQPINVTGLLVIGKPGGEYVRATLGLLDFAHDLAVLRPKGISDEDLEKEYENGLELANQNPIIGQPVGYAGYPLGTQLLKSGHFPTYMEGVIGSQVRQEGIRKQIQITGPVAGGFSGAPVVDRVNPTKVLGVLSRSPSKEAGDANIFMAISCEHIKAMADLMNS